MAESITAPRCPQCGGELPAWNVLTTRAIAPGCYDVGILCDHCGFWEHSYYDSDRIRLARSKFRLLDRRAQMIGHKALTALINSEQRRVKSVKVES